jgi:nitrite reductase/ring-hydroxylating ferredoxin subunit
MWGAAFRFDDGYCVEGPCLGASLDAVAVSVSDGRVRLLTPPD